MIEFYMEYIFINNFKYIIIYPNDIRHFNTIIAYIHSKLKYKISKFAVVNQENICLISDYPYLTFLTHLWTYLV